MKSTIKLNWQELAPPVHMVGIRMNMELHVLAYRLNQKYDLQLVRRRKKNEHVAFYRQLPFHFPLFSGIWQETGAPLHVLGAHSLNKQTPAIPDNSGLFADSAEIQYSLTKDPRKPDAFLLLELEEEAVGEENVWISHLDQIKGVISAFHFHPFRTSEAENFILD